MTNSDQKTDHHLVQQHSKGPPVNGLGVSLTLEQFRGDVLGSTAECWMEEKSETYTKACELLHTVGFLSFGHVQLAKAFMGGCQT